MKNRIILSILSGLVLISAQNMGIAQEQTMLEMVEMFGKAGDSTYYPSVSKLLEELTAHSVVLREGKDEDLRPLFVNVQADFERALVQGLKKKQIKECTCIIHTPTPATPLCTDGEISTGLVDPAISNDPKRLLTVKKRPDIIREYLHEGGRLLAVYPRNGRALRSAEQLAVFDDLLKKYPELKAIELDLDQIPDDLIGATYLIRVSDSEEYVLSIRSYQANSPNDGTWAIWFGSLQDTVVAERLEKVLSFLGKQGLLFDKESG